VVAAAPGFLRARSSLPEEGAQSGQEVIVVLDPAVALRGVVVDARGYAVGDAEVRAVQRTELGPAWDDPGVFGRSGADGRFRLDGLEADSAHVVHVRREGYAPAVESVAPATASSGRARPGRFPELRTVLHEDRVLRGRVLDEAGAPVAGARVLVVHEELVRSRPQGSPGIAETATASDGSFKFEQMVAGRVALALSAAGHAPLRKEGVELPQEGGVIDLGELVLEPEAVVEGRVVDPEGAPVEGARVVARAAPVPMTLRPSSIDLIGDEKPVATGADGRFRIGGLPGERMVRLEVQKEGFAAASIRGVRAPTEEPVAVVLRPAARVRGTVVDGRGRPIPDAEISRSWRTMSFGSPGGLFRPVRTDERGEFEIDDLSPGPIAFEAEASGYRMSSPVTVELAPGELLDGVEIVLHEGTSVTGRVVGPDGLPVAEAQVSARIESGEGLSTGGRGFARTAADGRFELDTLAPGVAIVVARKEGFAEATETLELGPGGASLELALGRGTVVSGWVLDPDGAPAAGIDLRLGSRGRTSSNDPRATSSADGSFVFRGVPEGEYRVRVMDGELSRWSVPDPIHVEGEAPVTGVEVRLPRTASLRGRLVGLEPSELRTAEVRAMGTGAGGIRLLPGRVDEDGTYRITELTPGDWTVIALNQAHGLQAQGTVEIEPGQTGATLDLEFGQGYTVTGTVTSGGEPVPGAAVAISGASMSGATRATTGLDGRFRIEGVAEGRSSLTVQDPGTGTMTPRTIEVDGDLDLRVEIETFRVRGVVYAADGSGPIGGASVGLSPLQVGEDPARWAFSASRRTVTGEDGSFLLTGLEDGRWHLKVSKSGYAAHASELLVAGGDVEAAPVYLESGGALEIRARLATGGSPEHLMFAVLGPPSLHGEQALDTGSARAAEEGRFVLSSVPPGSHVLQLWTMGSAVVRVQVEVPGSVDVTLPPPCTLVVSVPDLAADGTPASFTLVDSSGDAPFAGFAPRGIPIAEGRAKIPSLAPGAWTVTVTAEDGRTWAGTVEVVPDSTGVENRLVLE
jgi:protocatechuate 3,4-dioxygenase beta subunit